MATNNNIPDCIQINGTYDGRVINPVSAQAFDMSIINPIASTVKAQFQSRLLGANNETETKQVTSEMFKDVCRAIARIPALRTHLQTALSKEYPGLFIREGDWAISVSRNFAATGRGIVTVSFDTKKSTFRWPVTPGLSVVADFTDADCMGAYTKWLSANPTKLDASVLSNPGKMVELGRALLEDTAYADALKMRDLAENRKARATAHMKRLESIIDACNKDLALASARIRKYAPTNPETVQRLLESATNPTIPA